MAEQIERLVVSLEASITKYERAMQRALGQTNSTARRIEQRFSRMNSVVNAGLGRFGMGLAAGVSIRGAQQLIDASVRMENALKVAGLAGEELTAVYDRLFAAAQRNAAPVESLVTLYGRAAIVQKELGVSTEELLNFTENVSLALRVAGTDAQSASGALLQLSQALGSGVVRAEEFNSMLEGALPIVQAAAAGLKEAGGSVARLRQLVVDGKVSSEAFFRAFEAGSVILQEKVAGAESTVSQSFVRLQNVMIDVAGKFNEGTEASKIIGSGLDDLGESVRALAEFFNQSIPAIQGFFNVISGGLGDLNKMIFGMRQLTEFDKLGFDAAVAINNLGLDPRILHGTSAGAGRVIDQTFSVIGETPQDQALLDYFGGVKTSPSGTAPAVAAPPPVVQPVSLSDYAAPTKSKGGGAKVSAAERERQAVRDLIADLQFEQSIIGKSIVDQEALRAVRRAGAAATAEQKAQIDELVRSNFAEQQQVQALQDAYDQLGEIGKDAFNSIVQAMADGKIEGEELLSILGDIASQLGSMFINNAFNSMMGKPSFDLGSMFGGFRAGGGSVDAGKAYVVGEKRPELFVPRTAGTIIPKVPGGGGSAAPVVHVSIDARGAQIGAADQIRQFARFELPALIQKGIQDPHAVG